MSEFAVHGNGGHRSRPTEQPGDVKPANSTGGVTVNATDTPTIVPPADSLPGKLANVLQSQGAPELALPDDVFDSEELMLILMEWGSKINRARSDTLLVGIQAKRDAIEVANREAIKKITDHFKKQASAEAKAKANKILGWIVKAVSFVAASVVLAAAIAATVSTGGAATPLLALAIIGFTASAGSFASQCSGEAGGPALGLESGLGALFDACGADSQIGEIVGAYLLLNPGPAMSALAVKCGADPEQAMIVGAVFTIASAVTMMVVGGKMASNAGAAVAAQGASSGLKSMMTVAALTQNAAAFTGGSVMVAQAGYQMSIAQDQKDADLIQADRKKIQAAITALQQLLTQDTEFLKEVIERAAEIQQIMSNIIASWGQGKSQVIGAMSSRQSV